MRAYWMELVKQAVSKWDTPFYLSTWQPIQNALEELKGLATDLPIRHWLSFKTHPVAPLIRMWRDIGYGVEVVSEYEFLAVLKEGFKPDQILVNGVAKQNWLPRHKIAGIRVHFDSLSEIDTLIAQAKACKWRIGLRCNTSEEYDPDEPAFGTQFGMIRDEVERAAETLRKKAINIESIHFHLRSNISSPTSYEKAIKETARICKSTNLNPTYIDCGGGFPVSGERSYEQKQDPPQFDLNALRKILLDIPNQIPSVCEIWFENGRYLTARSAVLVVQVIDIKSRDESRYLICDGGRTNHALVSDWEIHDFFTIPRRNGPLKLTTICGPTCMAFDRLVRADLSCDIAIGDYIIWMNAGAYHIPWETRFSHGFAKVMWCDDNGNMSLTRKMESFAKWWGCWE